MQHTSLPAALSDDDTLKSEPQYVCIEISIKFIEINIKIYDSK
jgi:hypothetical protein